MYSGCEILRTIYGTPEQECGQHTNGTSSVWVRFPGGKWHHIQDGRQSSARQAIDLVLAVQQESRKG